MPSVKQELKDNWLVVFIAFNCILFAFSGPAFSLPFIFRSVIEEFGWTREQATLLASVKYATGAVVAIIVGTFIDFTGVKKVLIGVTLCGGIALLSFLWTSSLVTYYCAGILLGVAATGTIVSMKVLLSRTYDTAQGTALGIALVGASGGAILAPLIVAALIEAYGWRIAIASMSLGIWVVSLPLMIFGIKEKTLEGSVKVGQANSSVRKTTGIRGLKQLAREGRFWMILVALAVAGLVDQGIIQHQNLYLELDLGIEPATVALAVSFMGAAGIFGRVFLGWTFDRMSLKGISLGYLVIAVSCILALGINGIFILLVFMLLRGLGHAAVLLDSAVAAKHCYGLKHIGILLGIFTAAVNVGFAIGPWLMGRMFEIYGSYTPSFILFAVLITFAAGIFAIIKPSYWLEQRNLPVAENLVESPARG
jgi:predicted MFS family arabinose efflux permease